MYFECWRRDNQEEKQRRERDLQSRGTRGAVTRACDFAEDELSEDSGEGDVGRKDDIRQGLRVQT
jgi:hypothetical protein